MRDAFCWVIGLLALCCIAATAEAQQLPADVSATARVSGAQFLPWKPRGPIGGGHGRVSLIANGVSHNLALSNQSQSLSQPLLRLQDGVNIEAMIDGSAHYALMFPLDTVQAGWQVTTTLTFRNRSRTTRYSVALAVATRLSVSAQDHRRGFYGQALARSLLLLRRGVKTPEWPAWADYSVDTIPVATCQPMPCQQNLIETRELTLTLEPEAAAVVEIAASIAGNATPNYQATAPEPAFQGEHVSTVTIARVEPVTLRISGPMRSTLYSPSLGRENPVFELEALGESASGSYTWEIDKGHEFVSFVGGLPTATGRTVQLTGVRASAEPQDVSVKVTFTKPGKSASASHLLTVVVPKFICECDITASPVSCGPGTIGGFTETKSQDPALPERFRTRYWYAIADQFGGWFVPQSFQKHPVLVSERVDKFKSNYGTLQGCAIPQRSINISFSTTVGLFSDDFARDCAFRTDNPPDILTTARQQVEINGWPVSSRVITYHFDRATSIEKSQRNACKQPVVLPASIRFVNPSGDLPIPR